MINNFQFLKIENNKSNNLINQTNQTKQTKQTKHGNILLYDIRKRILHHGQNNN